MLSDVPTDGLGVMVVQQNRHTTNARSGAARSIVGPATRYADSSEDASPAAPELLTDAQLAERWQLSRGTLANQRSQGRGPAYLKIAGRVRYRRSEVEAFEQSGHVSTGSSTDLDGVFTHESIELLIRSIGS